MDIIKKCTNSRYSRTELVGGGGSNNNNNSDVNAHLKTLIQQSNNNGKRHYSRKRTSLGKMTSKRHNPKQRGIVFIWPQKETDHFTEQLKLFTCILAHTLYWLHLIHILPCGTALKFNTPRWETEKPVQRPQQPIWKHNNIIEPDWDSK